MKRQLKDLMECLFDAFCNQPYYSPQSEEIQWAIVEGLNRLDNHEIRLDLTLNEGKELDCLRGHKIRQGDRYIKYNEGKGWGDGLSLCLGCMSMILYFKGVDKLTPIAYTHWDFEESKPVYENT